MATTINMHEAKSSLSALVKRVLDGEEVTIARAGEPLVDLVPHRARRVDIGLAKGAFICDPDVFDGPDEEIATLFYGPESPGEESRS